MHICLKRILQITTEILELMKIRLKLSDPGNNQRISKNNMKFISKLSYSLYQ